MTVKNCMIRNHENIWMPLNTFQHLSDDVKYCSKMSSFIICSASDNNFLSHVSESAWCIKYVCRIQNLGACGRDLHTILFRSEFTAGKCWLEFRLCWGLRTYGNTSCSMNVTYWVYRTDRRHSIYCIIILKSLSPTCFGTSAPSSGNTKCQCWNQLPINSRYLQGSSACSSSVVDADCVQKVQLVLHLYTVSTVRLVGAINRVHWYGQCTDWTTLTI